MGYAMEGKGRARGKREEGEGAEEVGCQFTGCLSFVVIFDEDM
jgi:hypothetical protein